MLFTSILLITVGYTMMYSALHGHWNFWVYFFPAQAPPAALAPTIPTTTQAVV